MLPRLTARDCAFADLPACVRCGTVGHRLREAIVVMSGTCARALLQMFLWIGLLTSVRAADLPDIQVFRSP
jgi:hypothetical protein